MSFARFTTARAAQAPRLAGVPLLYLQPIIRKLLRARVQHFKHLKTTVCFHKKRREKSSNHALDNAKGTHALSPSLKCEIDVGCKLHL